MYVLSYCEVSNLQKGTNFALPIMIFGDKIRQGPQGALGCHAFGSAGPCLRGTQAAEPAQWVLERSHCGRTWRWVWVSIPRQARVSGAAGERMAVLCTAVALTQPPDDVTT